MHLLGLSASPVFLVRAGVGLISRFPAVVFSRSEIRHLAFRFPPRRRFFDRDRGKSLPLVSRSEEGGEIRILLSSSPPFSSSNRVAEGGGSPFCPVIASLAIRRSEGKGVSSLKRTEDFAAAVFPFLVSPPLLLPHLVRRQELKTKDVEV